MRAPCGAGQSLRFNTKFSDLRLHGETGSGAGAGIHSGPSWVSLNDVARAGSALAERYWTAGSNLMILQRFLDSDAGRPGPEGRIIQAAARDAALATGRESCQIRPQGLDRARGQGEIRLFGRI